MLHIKGMKRKQIISQMLMILDGFVQYWDIQSTFRSWNQSILLLKQGIFWK